MKKSVVFYVVIMLLFVSCGSDDSSSSEKREAKADVSEQSNDVDAGNWNINDDDVVSDDIVTTMPEEEPDEIPEEEVEEEPDEAPEPVSVTLTGSCRINEKDGGDWSDSADECYAYFNFKEEDAIADCEKRSRSVYRSDEGCLGVVLPIVIGCCDYIFENDAFIRTYGVEVCEYDSSQTVVQQSEFVCSKNPETD